MKLPSDADKHPNVELALQALAAIAQVVGGATAQTAAGAVTIIRVIIHTLDESRAGKVTPDAARAALDKLTQAIHANDSDADATLRRKFSDSDP